METTWYRLCIDLDKAGNPIGSSYEVITAGQPAAFHVLESPGPFDTPRQLLTRLLVDLEDRYGTHPTFL